MDGLYLLWWVHEKQMSPALVAATMAAGDLLLMGLEVPTGWFADRFGNRRSLILGSLIQVAGMICCWRADGISGLVVACLLVAIGDAFRSGADQALLYRTCVALNREDAFQRIEARSRAVQVIALAGLIAGGGAIVTRWGFAAGWAAEVLLSAAGCAIGWAMVEPPAQASRPAKCDAQRARNAHNEAHSGPKARIPWKTATLVILPAAFLGSAASAGSFILQTRGDSGATGVTLLVALITLADAAGSALAMRLPAAPLRAQVSLAAVGLTIVAAAVTISQALVPSTIALAFAAGISHPLRATAIHRLASDHVRARAASVANACDMAFSTITLLITGSRLAKRR